MRSDGLCVSVAAASSSAKMLATKPGERDFRRRQGQSIRLDKSSTKWMATILEEGQSLDRELSLAVLEREKPGVAMFVTSGTERPKKQGSFDQFAMSSYQVNIQVGFFISYRMKDLTFRNRSSLLEEWIPQLTFKMNGMKLWTVTST